NTQGTGNNRYEFGPSWHVGRVRAGKYWLPACDLPPLNPPYTDKTGVLRTPARSADNAKYVATYLTPALADLQYLGANGLGLTLITDNICDLFSQSRYRLPKVAASIPSSPLTWIQNPDGSVDDTPLADPFADPNIWSTEGGKWGASVYVQALTQAIPAVP